MNLKLFLLDNSISLLWENWVEMTFNSKIIQMSEGQNMKMQMCNAKFQGIRFKTSCTQYLTKYQYYGVGRSH